MTKSKTTKAAALRYDCDESPAPRVVARGDGLVAERILAIAREHNIPIHQDPALVNVLSQLDLDQQIPPALYLAIAEVLAFLYRTGALEPRNVEPGPFVPSPNVPRLTNRLW